MNRSLLFGLGFGLGSGALISLAFFFNKYYVPYIKSSLERRQLENQQKEELIEELIKVAAEKNYELEFSNMNRLKKCSVLVLKAAITNIKFGKAVEFS
jgi:hypothetical protein